MASPPPPFPALPLPLLLLITISISSSSSLTITGLISPVYFDPKSNYYTATLEIPSPTGHGPVILDLDNSNLWRDCVNPSPYTSPTLKPILCNNTQACADAFSCTSNICGSAGCYDDQCTTQNGFQYPACSNYTCASWASITGIATLGTSVWSDAVSLLATDGKRLLPKVTMADFSFLCADNTLLSYGAGKIPAGTAGGTGLSRGAIALPTQISVKIPSIRRIFAYCLPSSTSSPPGVIFFGDGPYFFRRSSSSAAIDVSKLLTYTPLVDFSKQKDSYFLQIQSISVGNSSAIAINSSLLTISKDKASKQYVGGTRFSSTVAYTQLHPSIYDTLAEAFKSAATATTARGFIVVVAPPGAPSDLCFKETSSRSVAPEIAITFKKKAVWRINGSNSLVKVSGGVSCLAFQKRAEYELRAVVIGTYQQQNAFFQFDLAANRLGFLPSMPAIGTSCSNFNFS